MEKHFKKMDHKSIKQEDTKLALNLADARILA